MNTLALKGKRIMQGRTQKSLAEALGITVASYSRKERGLQPFTLSDLQGLIKELCLSAYEVDAIFFDFQLTQNETKSKSIIKLIG